MSDEPAYPGDQPSSRAMVAWRHHRDLHPLLKLLKSGQADADAQALAGELLMAATQKKLPDTKKGLWRTTAILSQWAMVRAMGTPPEKAKAAVAEMFDISVKTVEKHMTNNPELVAQLKAELKF